MDTVSLILIAVIVVAVVLLLQRLMNRNNYSQQGPNRPQYNDPNITSHGGFGGNQQGNYQQGGFNHRQYDDPNIESHGGFGRSGGSSDDLRESERRSSFPSASSERTVTHEPESTRRNDNPNVSSHGGFGGQR